LARVGTRSTLLPERKILPKRWATTSRPWYSRGIDGMVRKMSPVSRVTSASTSTQGDRG
jgi:hypothetical protein